MIDSGGEEGRGDLLHLAAGGGELGLSYGFSSLAHLYGTPPTRLAFLKRKCTAQNRKLRMPACFSNFCFRAGGC